MEFSNVVSTENPAVFIPVVLLSAALIVAAAIDFWKLKVPNWLTFPLILSGWVYGLLHGVFAEEGFTLGYMGASLALTVVGLVLLLPVYAIGGMGAGDVKMQMGFGAWVGSIFGLASGFWVVFGGFCVAAVVGGAIAMGMIFWRGDFRQNRKNVAEIVRDWFGSKSVYQVSEKAAARKPRMHLLPYGVPLCIGFLAYLFLVGV